MLVNGKEVLLQEGQALHSFLVAQGYDPKRVAVERNGEIVPRARFLAEILDGEDKLEIVCFVGGG